MSNNGNGWYVHGLMGRDDDVEFVVCPANKLPFEDESVDLLTCAAAWRWLDQNTVFAEIDRITKRPAVLTVYTYMQSSGIVPLAVA